jgi:predicted PurR-regulated permease PerM
MVSVVTTLIIIPFAVFFLLKDGPAMKTAFVSLIPNKYFEMSLNLIYKIDRQLGNFLRGQFFDASLVGLMAIFAMWMLDVRYYILVGIFAGLTNMIPYVGPFTGGVTAVFVVLMSGGSGHQVLLVVAAFLIIQLMDNVLIQPLIVSKSVNLHPLVIIFAVIIGGQFFGILGMLLAVPATGILKVFAIELYNSFQKYGMV